MKRRTALVGLAGVAGTLGTSIGRLPAAGATQEETALPHRGKPVRPPVHGPVQVAIVMGPELVSIDMFGPMAVFDNAMLSPDGMGPQLFNPYAVAETTRPLDVDGLKIQPQFSFANAPQPHVLIVPMQQILPSSVAYIRKASARADVTMSVCTGAFLVAKAGLFNGQRATTHHSAYDELEKMYPQITVVRGPRYVEDANVSSSGGESCGIDLCLRIVERYYGTTAARVTAYNMEYRRTPRPLNMNQV